MTEPLHSTATATPILIVDDDPDIREALRDILDDAGYSVVLAFHGQMALELLGTMGPPCLVLLDWMMPVMDGAQFLHLLRENPLYDTVKVILCTASGRDVPPGAQGLLRKPFELDELLAVVSESCG
ncbi:response regulator [Archangium lansingense]|uniref:Response regulator n=1 Tax=Archangium lansingense TaxID=2995310 RepID=A0ABT3ZZ18_9BACT|nr:response regulator [Archangium lansinium]MCY1074635.1 response regulator [Archangium lansinium]